MSFDNLFHRVVCKETICLPAVHVHDRYRDVLLLRLKRKVEGVCTRHGFTKPDSVVITKVQPGRVDPASLSGMTHFTVWYAAETCLPFIGMTVQGTVKAINRFGILVTCGYTQPDGTEVGMLEAVVPRDTAVQALMSSVPLDAFEVGDRVRVVIQGKKIHWGNPKINAIGRIVVEESSEPVDDAIDSLAAESTKCEDEEDEVTDEETQVTDQDGDDSSDERVEEENVDLEMTDEEDEENECDIGSTDTYDDDHSSDDDNGDS